MKTAICLSGLIGNTKGKSDDYPTGDSEVLKLAYKHWKEKIIDNNDVDFFVHSWDVDHQHQIQRLFNPKEFLFEKQLKFSVPEHIKGDARRNQAHYSRWYSTMASVDLKSKYEAANNFRYDWVMVSRFDIAWKVPIIFGKHDNAAFYCGGWYNQSDVSVKDFWFFSNSDNMNKFSRLYNHIGDYMLNSNRVLNKKISSHKLAKYHLNKLKYKVKYLLKCEDNIDPSKSDYPLIRYQYFGAQE